MLYQKQIQIYNNEILNATPARSQSATSLHLFRAEADPIAEVCEKSDQENKNGNNDYNNLNNIEVKFLIPQSSSVHTDVANNAGIGGNSIGNLDIEKLISLTQTSSREFKVYEPVDESDGSFLKTNFGSVVP